MTEPSVEAALVAGSNGVSPETHRSQPKCGFYPARQDRFSTPRSAPSLNCIRKVVRVNGANRSECTLRQIHVAEVFPTLRTR